MGDLTHFDEHGASRMVHVGGKPVTPRRARARATVVMASATLTRIRDRGLAKGDVLEVARLAGIMAAKRTAELIPLCHALSLDAVEIQFSFAEPDRVVVESCTDVTARTGVEMEALVGASIAALTIYDMCKSIDREMRIADIVLLEKSGGRSGHFVREEPKPPA